MKNSLKCTCILWLINWYVKKITFVEVVKRAIIVTWLSVKRNQSVAVAKNNRVNFANQCLSPKQTKMVKIQGGIH